MTHLPADALIAGLILTAQAINAVTVHWKDYTGPWLVRALLAVAEFLSVLKSRTRRGVFKLPFVVRVVAPLLIAGAWTGCADRLAVIERATEQAITEQLDKQTQACELAAQTCRDLKQPACPAWDGCDRQRRELTAKAVAFADALHSCATRARSGAAVDEVKACLAPVIAAHVLEVAP